MPPITGPVTSPTQRPRPVRWAGLSLLGVSQDTDARPAERGDTPGRLPATTGTGPPQAKPEHSQIARGETQNLKPYNWPPTFMRCCSPNTRLGGNMEQDQIIAIVAAYCYRRQIAAGGFRSARLVALGGPGRQLRRAPSAKLRLMRADIELRAASRTAWIAFAVAYHMTAADAHIRAGGHRVG